MKTRFNFSILFILSTTWAWSQSAISSKITPLISPTEPIICNTSQPFLGRPIAEVAPEYPKRALRAKIQGDVVLDLSVSEEGKVVSVSVVSGDLELSREAAKAIQKWEYLPSQEHDVAERHTRITLVFKIDDVGKPMVGAEFPSPPRFCSGDQRVTVPRALYSPNPSYSEEARRAKLQGVCILGVIVGPDGLPQEVKIERPLGHGLDEKAIEAVKQWKFDPARRNGTPIAVKINVEVQFRDF